MDLTNIAHPEYGMRRHKILPISITSRDFMQEHFKKTVDSYCAPRIPVQDIADIAPPKNGYRILF